MAQVIYSGLGDGNADLSGELFEGLKFFVSQRCPLRTTYLDKIISNGGRVVKFEQQADYLIADHFKRNLNPAGALSYTVIDDAIRAGQLPDFNEAKYIAGPETGSFRAVGSSRPIKVGRTPFTLEDKVQLYDWVQSVARRGGSTRGNEIYKQLESINPRHTYQAWRDHWVKQLDGRPRPGGDTIPVRYNAPPTPPIDIAPPQFDVSERNASVSSARDSPVQQPRAISRAAPAQAAKRPSATHGFTADDVHDLLSNGDDIMDTRVRHEYNAWEAWAAQSEEHTGRQWMMFWKRAVMPVFGELEDAPARRKVYNKHWEAFKEAWRAEQARKGEHVENGGLIGASADEWLEHYRTIVLPLFAEIPRGASATPVKRDSSQVIRRYASGSARTESSPTEPSRKRQRMHEATPRAEPAAPQLQDEIEAVDRFINIPEDDLTQSRDTEEGDAAVASPSLPKGKRIGSRPVHVMEDTQAILEESQELDLSVPEPEGGFDADDFDELGEGQAPEGTTNGPDIDFLEASSTLNPGAGPQASWPSLAERCVAIGIGRLIQEGHDGDAIKEAALRTSCDPALFPGLLDRLERGRGVPKGTRGIWTEEDDEVATGTEARLLAALEKKHASQGLHSVEGRLTFLREFT